MVAGGEVDGQVEVGKQQQRLAGFVADAGEAELLADLCQLQVVELHIHRGQRVRVCAAGLGQVVQPALDELDVVLFQRQRIGDSFVRDALELRDLGQAAAFQRDVAVVGVGLHQRSVPAQRQIVVYGVAEDRYQLAGADALDHRLLPGGRLPVLGWGGANACHTCSLPNFERYCVYRVIATRKPRQGTCMVGDETPRAVQRKASHFER